MKPKTHKKLLTVSSVLAIFALNLTNVFAASVTTYSKVQGLNNTNLATVFRDSGHFVWVGAEDGLLRFAKLMTGVYVKEFNINSGGNGAGKEIITLHWPMEESYYCSTIAYLIYIAVTFLFIKVYLCLRHRVHRKRELELKRQIKKKTDEIVARKNEAELLLREKQSLIENISHELKTPLTLIFNSLENIHSESLNESTLRNTSIIQSNGDRLLRLIDQLLSTASLREEEHKGVVVLSCICNEVVSSLQDKAQERGLTFVLELSADLILVLETDKLLTLLNNLLTNAIKYAEPNSSITISAGIEYDLCKIAVANQGKNLSPEESCYIFEKFKRLPRHRHIEGHGIGLSYAKEVVNSYQGNLIVDNSVANLVKFIIELPKEHVLNVESVATVRDSQVSSKQCPKKLVVVEDNVEINQFLVQLLRDEYQVMSFYDGCNVLESLEGFQPDLILADVMMPMVDGFELCNIIRNSEQAFANVPIILLTAKKDYESQKRGLDVGATDYLSKPFSGKLLKLKIKNLLELNPCDDEVVKEAVVNPPVATQVEVENSFADKLKTQLTIHFPDPELNVKKLAELLAMDERTLRRKTEAFFSKKPKDMIRDYRLLRAYEMLSSGDRISTISESCGFATAAHFSKCFKQRYGVTPKQMQTKLVEQELNKQQ